jgi:hypothetical protein
MCSGPSMVRIHPSPHQTPTSKGFMKRPHHLRGKRAWVSFILQVGLKTCTSSIWQSLFLSIKMSEIVSIFSLPTDFNLSSISTWPQWFKLAYGGAIYLGLEILSHIVHILFGWSAKIPARGKHLDEFNETGMCTKW